MSGFHEVQFPTGISWGSIGGPMMRTAISTLPSGQEQRVQLWTGGRLKYNARYGIKTPGDLAEVQRFFRARAGAAYGFRFKDWMDFHSHPTNPTYVLSDGSEFSAPSEQDQEIGTGTGSKTTFQLRKAYASGPTTIYRNITKPVAGTTRIWVNSVEQMSGWTVDTTTGIVTFSVAPINLYSVEASFEFDVPARFDSESGEILQASIDAFDIGEIPDIPIIELLDEAGAYTGEYYYGGSEQLSLTANYTLSVTNFAAYISTSAGLDITLPDPTSLPDGRPLKHVINAGSNSFNLIEPGTPSTLVALAAGETALCSVIKAGVSSTKEWHAI